MTSHWTCLPITMTMNSPALVKWNRARPRTARWIDVSSVCDATYNSHNDADNVCGCLLITGNNNNVQFNVVHWITPVESTQPSIGSKPCDSIQNLFSLSAPRFNLRDLLWTV